LVSCDSQRLSAPVGRGHHAGVDLADLALRGRRVLVLDDAQHPRRPPHRDDAAVAGGVGQLDGQQRQALPGAVVDQVARRGPLHQRHVAIEDQGGALVVQLRQRLLHRVAGAELRHLAREGEMRRGDGAFDFLRALAVITTMPSALQFAGGLQDVLQ
jgi:hypothetical protein